MATARGLRVLDEAAVRQYRDDGSTIASGLVTPEECERLIARSIELHDRMEVPGCFHAVSEAEAGGDPLKTWPRMMHPHRVDDLSLHFLRHPRVVAALEDLLDREAVGLQTMFYWKPPGARGQDFHQDDYYLQTEPDACIAAWLALEPIDEGNGALVVFPGSHREPILPMSDTDTARSFTSTAVTPPPAYAPRLVTMQTGDVLFFHGHLIHGSYPNDSADRFRKSFISHYVPADATSYNHGYDPSVVLR